MADLEGDWETADQIRAACEAAGVTHRRRERWSSDGLIPRALQTSVGSPGRFPSGTCRQMAAAAALFRHKDDSKFVGFRLWWLGFPVDEHYWLPAFEDAARMLDRILRLVPNLRDRFDRRDEALTLQETLAERRGSNFILSRVNRRLHRKDLEIFYRVDLDLMSGHFEGFDQDQTTSAVDGRKPILAEDKRVFFTALDLHAATDHTILGNKINTDRALPTLLKSVASTLRTHSFMDEVRGPSAAILKARDDVRNALLIAWTMHDALKWIYGDTAFGLRLAAWMAKKCPDRFFPYFILLFLRLRQGTGLLLSSAEIRKLAETSKETWHRQKLHQYLYEHEPRFRQVLNPRRIKEAFVDSVSLQKWRSEIDSVLQSS